VPDHVDGVANDDAAGASLVARHLLGLGHRRIGQLLVDSGAGRMRSAAFARTAEDAGVEVVCSQVADAADSVDGYRATLDLLRGSPGLTAIFAPTDIVAIGALGAARELDLTVPGGLSVAGYDNIGLAGTRLVDLTTVDNRSTAVGREAGTLLLERFTGRDGPGVRRVLAPELVLRGTTAPPR
jgi:DNA-binding LacI/PurR family transcriptional regulator